jgi:signal transduction histidine kinase
LLSSLMVVRLNTLALLLSMVCLCVFAWRFGRQALPRAERGMWVATGILAAALLLAPDAQVSLMQAIGAFAALALFFGTCLQFPFHAWRTREPEHVALAVWLLLSPVVIVHDILLVMQRIAGPPLTPYMNVVTTLFMTVIVGLRHARHLRHIEGFGHEMARAVTQARGELAEGLRHQHEAELEQTRLAERLNLVRDLHDGLGMTLNSHIHALGNRDGVDTALQALQDVNDDLRLIIESSGFDDSDALGERLVPLRHRCTRLLEAAGIQCHWTLDGLQRVMLGGKRGLDFLRLMQEGLANVLKHSGATRVEIHIEARQGQLALTIRDNGRGFKNDAAAPGSTPRSALTGMGLRNMRARASRLGGALDIRSDATGSVLTLRCPVDAATVT